MGDAAPQVDGAAADGGGLLPGPSRQAQAQSRIKANRRDTLAAFEKGEAGPGKSAPPELEQRKTSTAAAKPAPKPASAPVEESADDEPELDAAPADDKPELEAKVDPDQSKRLAAIAKAEKHAREKITKERGELEADRKRHESEWAPRVKAAEDFERLVKQAKRGGTHLVSAVRALGIGDDDFEAAAQVLYAHSKAGAADPARKAASERLLRERELEDDRSATTKRIDELEHKLATKERDEAFGKARDGFLDHTLKLVGNDAELTKLGLEAPLAQKAAAKNPTKLRARLWDITQELARANDGDVPDFDDVIATYEKRRRDELDELGIEAPVPAKSAKADDAPSKKNHQTADKKQPAKTLGQDLSTTRVPRTRRGEREHRADTLAMLESGKLE